MLFQVPSSTTYPITYRVVRALWLLVALLVSTQLAPAQGKPDLLLNAGLEDAGENRLPRHWEPQSIGAPAQFAADTQEKHGGRQSVRITAPEVTRSYLRSESIAIAPGERLLIAAWVKCRDVPADQGTVIAIAEFTNAQDRNPLNSKIGVATLAAPTGAASPWQRIQGTVTAPPLAANLRLRLGFSYARGTCWWDDIEVQALSPLVARIELPTARLVPATAALPITILNRAATRGPARIRVTLGRQFSMIEVNLSGEAMQRVQVPIKVLSRGSSKLTASLFLPGQDKALWSEERTVVVPPPLVLAPLIPTHWAREDGTPRLAGEIDLAVTADERAGARLTARLLDGQNQERAVWSSDAAGTTKRGPLEGTNHFGLSAPGLPAGSYRVVVQWQPRQGQAISVEQPWEIISRRQARVTLNENGYLEQDGKVIFPLGIFNGGARMQEMGEAGFTVSHAYNAIYVEPGEKPNDQRVKKFLDDSEKAGLRMLFLVPMKFAIAGDWEAFRRRIRMFRNHPALLAWDEEEGLARGDMKLETLTKIRQILREEDPHHPLMIGDARDVIGRVTDRSNFFPIDQMDLGMWWWYPFPLPPASAPGKAQPGDALQGEEAVQRNELVPPTFLTRRNTHKPLWVGVQSYKKPNKEARYPTPTEYRAQAYLAFMHGAKGLMWYGGSVTGGLYLAPEEGHWNDLKTLARELKQMAPILMSPSIAAPTFLSAEAPISVALKRAPGRLVLIAANRGATAVDVAFALPKIAAPIPVLFENRTVTADTTLRDRFEPYAVHIYELPEQVAGP